jgi:hypothetical protein
MPNPDLMWIETKPGLWRSVDGKYAIVRTVLPEDRPNPAERYTLRKFDPASVAAYPGNLGYFVAEEYTLPAAQAHAARDAYCDAHASERHVPADFPALALQSFFWPISDGTTRAALAIVWDGDRVVARVIDMARQEDPFEPVVYAEIDFYDALSGRAQVTGAE